MGVSLGNVSAPGLGPGAWGVSAEDREEAREGGSCLEKLRKQADSMPANIMRSRRWERITRG